MKHYLILLTFLCFGIQTQAQKYITAAGLRVGTGAGVTIQQRIIKGITVEGIFQQGLFKPRSNVMLLLENHKKIAFQRRFNFYYGAGLQFGNETVNDIKDNTFGIAGILGAEMTVGRINLSLDWNPRINLKGSETINMGTAISARYVIIKAPKADILPGNNNKKKKAKKKKKKKKKKWKELLK